MKRANLILIVSVAALCVAASKTKVYKGDWFEISYPAEFSARKSLADSAFFRAKDKSVEFYVFAPQWNGEPSDVALDRTTEKLVAKTEERKRNPLKEEIVVRRMTCKALDGSYSRSVEDTENVTLNTRHAFGIRYRDAKALSKWRKDYLAFKGSLEQFAD